jgi:hypothetical protein
MKRLVTVALVLALAFSARAQVDPDTNSIGIYFDEEATRYCYEWLYPYETLEMYTILVNPGFDELIGFEMGMAFNGDAMILGYQYPLFPMVETWDPWGYFLAGGMPTPMQETNILIKTTLMSMDSAFQPIVFFVGGLDMGGRTSKGGIQTGDRILDPRFPVLVPQGADYISASLSVELGQPAAIINGDCTVVDTEKSSFGSLKSLYR